MLRIESLTKTFRSGGDTVRALDDVTLTVENGELLVLLGPSGCGKTTALRCIAGLESADSGRISFGERRIFDSAERIDVAPEKRDIGMVFQSYALWPHKTVEQNIAYPLKVRKMTKELNEGWVKAVADVVDCGPLLGRYPGQLSGGQQQRVALARGLVARPELMLFDEPLSNLDALLRVAVRNELHELHRRLDFTGVYVTHDQAEALAIGDRLAIMRSGRIEQIGSAQDLYDRPSSDYVANFVGYANTATFARTGTGWALTGGAPADAPVDVGPLPLANGIDVAQLRFRPEGTRLVAGPGDGAESRSVQLPGRFVDSVYAGNHEEAAVDVQGRRMTVAAPVGTGLAIAPGADVTLTIPAERCRWYDDAGKAIALA